MASSKITVLVIGGTGAQGAAIVQSLSASNKYNVIAMTRNTTSSAAKKLAALPNVELVSSNAEHGYNEMIFSETASRADAVFVNTDGFSLGEALETFWGIRLFELSARAGVKHFVYSGLDSVQRLSGYDPDLYVGHYEGKAKVQEWMRAQETAPMAWTIIRSGPYAETLSEIHAPRLDSDGTYVFALPLPDHGEIPFVSLATFGDYLDWTLSHREEVKGLDFAICIEQVSLAKLTQAFTAATGKKARAETISIGEWHKKIWAGLPQAEKTKIGFLSVKDDLALHLTYEQNFTNWWNLYKSGLIKRDCGFLDRILPTRERTMEEWMKRAGYTGEYHQVLKRNAPS